MAFYIFKINHFPFPKPLILFYLLIITSFFSPLRQFTSALSFNFTSFNYGDSDITYDTALVVDSVIQLTDSIILGRSELVGRATYSSPMHLWDKASGNLTDFSTYFTCQIESQSESYTEGGGLAFFLAPNGSTIPKNVNQGAGMGLAKDDQLLNSTDNPFVAVEFDTYSNEPWDSPGYHVGIDINSKSVANIPWLEVGEARISYNSSSHNLSVILNYKYTYYVNDTRVYPNQSLSYNVDLRDYLPEWVTFGFSAATGSSSTMYSIHTWNFSSTLEDTVAKQTVTSCTRRNLAPNRSKNKRLELAMGLGGGGSFLLGGFALILFGFWKRNKRDTEEDLAFDRCMDDEFQRETGPNKFSFNELAYATNNFNDEEKLGQGGFGGVYKGFLREPNSFIVIKRVSKGSKQGMKEYASEVKIISRLRHRNLVQLIGWCHER